MPLSPITRFLGLAIVAAYALALLWPVRHVDLLGPEVWVALPFIMGFFAWSAVRDAAPFDDRAFHRTLPPGDGFAFWQVLSLHAWVLIGIALSVVIYCRVFNFGWQVMSYGILALTAPVCAFMGAGGVAASLSSSRQWGRTWGYIAIFMVPLFSATVLYGVHRHLPPEERGDFYLSSHRTMAVTGALLYPLVWWLVAVRRHWWTGLVLGSALGALFPWIYIYGGFVPPEETRDEPILAKSHITLTRNPMIPTENKWLPLENLISISGLREGEYFYSDGISCGKKFLHSFEAADDLAPDHVKPYPSTIYSGKIDNKVIWGKTAIWDAASRQIPHIETFGYWNRKFGIPTQLATLNAGKSDIITPAEGDASFEPHEIRTGMTKEDFTSETWTVRYGVVMRTEEVGVVDASTGGRCRLPEGGVIQVSSVYQESGSYSISFRVISDGLRRDDYPWFEPKQDGWWREPWVIAVDESGKHAYALAQLKFVSRKHDEVMLGNVSNFYFNAGEAKTREDLARMEMLRRCKLHIFRPKMVERVDQDIPPPQR